MDTHKQSKKNPTKSEKISFKLPFKEYHKVKGAKSVWQAIPKFWNIIFQAGMRNHKQV